MYHGLRDSDSRMAVLNTKFHQWDKVPPQASDAPSAALVVERRGENLLAVKFVAMASPCEVLIPSMEHDAALAIGAIAANEALRIEKKFSRYRNDSVTAWIHERRGAPVEVDEETAALIDFASQCHDLSDG